MKILNKVIEYIKYIEYLWINVISMSLIMESIGMLRYTENNNSTELWAWGTSMFILSIIAAITSMKIYEKQILKELKVKGIVESIINEDNKLDLSVLKKSDLKKLSDEQVHTISKKIDEESLKEERLECLKILNEHFKNEGNLGCLTDRQVKLVLDAMIEIKNN